MESAKQNVPEKLVQDGEITPKVNVSVPAWQPDDKQHSNLKCQKCNYYLQASWKICPFCGEPVANTPLTNMETIINDVAPLLMQNKGSPEVPGGRVDLVHFSVTSPPFVQPNYSFVVIIWAHLQKQMSKVIQTAQEASSTGEVKISTQGPLKTGTRYCHYGEAYFGWYDC